MARVEVDEAELLTSRSVVAAVNEMLRNPKSKELLEQARKTANPQAYVPGVDDKAPINAALDDFRKELKAEREAREKDRQAEDERRRLDEARRQVDEQKGRLRAAGYTTEGIAAVEKMAEERGIFDLEAAAALHEKLNPPPAPAEPNGFGSWGFFDQETKDDTFVQKMMESRGEDDEALHREVHAALREVRGQPAR